MWRQQRRVIVVNESVVTSFTATQLANGEVSFVHDGREETSSTITYSVNGTPQSAIAVTITPVDDRKRCAVTPVAGVADTRLVAAEISGKSGGDALLDGDIDLSGYFGDPDAGDTVSYRISSVSHDGTAPAGAALAPWTGCAGRRCRAASRFPAIRRQLRSDGLGDLVVGR